MGDNSQVLWVSGVRCERHCMADSPHSVVLSCCGVSSCFYLALLCCLVVALLCCVVMFCCVDVS